jgi:hypothetical protein
MAEAGSALSLLPESESESRSETVPLLGLKERIAWGAVTAAVCLAAALIGTWPLALNLTTSVLLATEGAVTVQLFSIWTLWWTADRAPQLFSGYWDAPIFYPNPGVFSYSEPEPLTGLAVAPLWGLGASPALIHNVALLAVLLLNGVFAYRLARALQIARLPALLGAVLMVTLPFVARLYGVINLIALFGILWTLDGLVRFGRDGSARHAAWASAGFVAAYLTCEQYALMFGLFAVAAALVALSQQRFRARPAIRLALAGLGAGLVLLPVALPVYTLHQQLNLARPDFVVASLSAWPDDFFTRPTTSWLDLPPHNGSDEPTGGLFPGAILLALAVAGLIVGRRSPDPILRRWTAYFALSTLAAVVLALGLNLDILGLSPFDVLRQTVPGFGELRSVYRFAIIMQLMLVVLAAIALNRSSQVDPSNRRLLRTGAGLALLLGLLAGAENLTVPVPLASVPSTPRTAWTTWLRAQPEDTVVAHVPFAAGIRVQDYEIDAWRMFAQIDHHKPIINGYSGYFPADYTQFQLDMAGQFPDPALLCTLNKGLKVNTLVVDQGWLATHKTQMAPSSAFLTPAYTDDKVQIYHLQIPDARCTR